MTIMIEGNIWTTCPGADQMEFPAADGKALEIWGYFDACSYRPGDIARLRVHTTAPTFDVRIIRDGSALCPVLAFRDRPGTRQQTPANAFEVGCQWGCPLEIEVPEDWEPGPYIAELRARDEAGNVVDGEAFFVLKPPRGRSKAPFALVLSTSTWTAYNDWGGANHYRSIRDGKASDKPAPVLSRQRPWARGFIRLPPDAPRHTDVPDLPRGADPTNPWLHWALSHGFSRHYPDAGWAHYERPFLVWAQQNGYIIDVLTQDDLHTDRDALIGYKAAIFSGHDEYWTSEMRDTLDAYVAGGGAVARFAGNSVWQVRIEPRFEQAYAVQVCYKMPQDDPVFERDPRRSTTYWDSSFVRRPATDSFGLTGSGGCYSRFGLCSPRGSGAFTVYRPHHWAFEGTDLRYGDLLGAAPARVAAFELDGVDYTFRGGLPYATGLDGASPDLEVLAMVPATLGERTRPGRAHSASLAEVQGLERIAPPFWVKEGDPSREYGCGMIASLVKGRGELFVVGACHWVNGLIRKDEYVETVTRNVLNRFLAR
jgi:hypothetical protein